MVCLPILIMQAVLVALTNTTAVHGVVWHQLTQRAMTSSISMVVAVFILIQPIAMCPTISTRVV